MKNESISPEPQADSCTLPVTARPDQRARSITNRHDGWTGDKMATFCETLAETAVVAEACDRAEMGISGAYALRRRNSFFAAAWDAALTIARERLADTLLARSMEGNVEQIWRDGEIVGERHVLDNRLGFAILRRLDRLAETGASISLRGERLPASVRAVGTHGAPALRSAPFDWELTVNALRTGDDGAIAQALALLKGHKVEEVEDPPISLTHGSQQPQFLDLSDRCWRDPLVDGLWLTDFAPPDGYSDYERRPYDEDDGGSYERYCTAEEAVILEADAAAGRAAERAEEETLRDSWFAALLDELDEDQDEGEDEDEDDGEEEESGDEDAVAD